MRFNIIHIYAKKKFSAAVSIHVDCKINFIIYEFVQNKMAQKHLKREETFNNSNDMQTFWIVVL